MTVKYLVNQLNVKQNLLEQYNIELKNIKSNKSPGAEKIVDKIKKITEEIEHTVNSIKKENLENIEMIDEEKTIDIPASITKRSIGKQDTKHIILLAQISDYNDNVVDLSYGDMTISITREDLSTLSDEFEF